MSDKQYELLNSEGKKMKGFYCLRYPDKFALAEHGLVNGHRIKFDENAVVARTNGFWDSIIKEAIEIKTPDNDLNRDGGLQLSAAWDPAIAQLKWAHRTPTQSMPIYGDVAEHQ